MRHRLIAVVAFAFAATIFSSPSSQGSGLGGYAVVHPEGYVCGVIVGNDYFSGNDRTMTSEYMGCPVGSRIIFQTKPSPSGNVAGWHGQDVTYSDGTFRLGNGTLITNGIATDPDGRVWDTGSGETLSPGLVTTPTPSPNPSESETVTSVGSDSATSMPSAPTETAPIATPTSSGTSKWTPPADSDRPITDDTYSKICMTLGWIECAEWTIFDANGNQLNRVVGPYPFSICVTSGVNLCGGTPKGFAVMTGRFFASTTSGGGGSVGNPSVESSSPTETAAATVENSSASATPQASDSSPVQVVQVETVTPVTSIETRVPSNPVAPTTTSPTPVSIIPIVESEGREEAPSAEFSVTKQPNGRYRVSIDSNLDSEALIVRAAKKGSKTIRFNITLNEEGAAILVTSRDLKGFRLALIFEGTVLTAQRVSS